MCILFFIILKTMALLKFGFVQSNNKGIWAAREIR